MACPNIDLTLSKYALTITAGTQSAPARSRDAEASREQMDYAEFADLATY